jgi:hypothetical protein
VKPRCNKCDAYLIVTKYSALVTHRCLKCNIQWNLAKEDSRNLAIQKDSCLTSDS